MGQLSKDDVYSQILHKITCYEISDKFMYIFTVPNIVNASPVCLAMLVYTRWENQNHTTELKSYMTFIVVFM